VVFGHYQWDWILVFATFLLIGACVLPLSPGRAVRGLEWRPLAALGTATYSLYLWHVSVIDILIDKFGVSETTLPLLVTAIPASVAVGVASYYVIERPFLKLRRQWSSASAPKPDEGVADSTLSPG
jgi:peptidoglycan/LPS O-acetylase OafA/YrhL